MRPSSSGVGCPERFGGESRRSACDSQDYRRMTETYPCRESGTRVPLLGGCASLSSMGTSRGIGSEDPAAGMKKARFKGLPGVRE